MSEREKTYVEDVNRSIYDIRNEEKDVYRIQKGLTPAIVEEISAKKKDPAWMANFRLQSLQIYNEMEVPDWGPSIEGLNMEDIVTYVKPNTHMSAKWSEVPEDIKDTFEKLGIPQAERKSLAGVGAQYDSELVYHNVREEVAAQGVVYTDMESALNGEYADMVRKHFMKLVTPRDHKFAALHGAVWSGGSFVYVPPGVSVTIPLQSYFRLNAPGAGQFEHTLIIVDEGAYLHFIEGCSAPKYNVANLHAGCVELYVKKGAKLRYSTIENWSKNMYNLNTKRALVLINTDTPRYEYIEKVKIKYDYSSLYGRYYGGDFYGASSSFKSKKDDDKDGQFKIEDYYGGGKAKNSVSDFYDEEPQLGLDLYSSIFHKKLCVPNSKVYLKNFNEPDSKPTESLDEYVIDKYGTIYGLDEDTAIYYPLQEQYKLVDDKGDLISYREEDSMEMPWAFYENIEKINDYIMNLSIYDMTYCTNLSDDFMMILLDAMYPGEANDETDCETFKPESEISVAICK
mgnify:CR=1 FL=1